MLTFIRVTAAHLSEISGCQTSILLSNDFVDSFNDETRLLKYVPFAFLLLADFFGRCSSSNIDAFLSAGFLATKEKNT